MRVTIDSARCQGHSRCTMIAPDVFDIDDDGKGTVLVTDVPAELVGDVHRAIGNCPERAISVA